jgi:tRNA (guanosine-2'-O-)-methyltransferase
MYLVNDERLSKMKNILLTRQNDLRIFMDNVYSSHNLSAIVRSSDAVNVGKLYYRHQEQVRLNDNITMGAHKWIFSEYVQEVEELYKKLDDYQIVVTVLGDDSLDFRDVDYTKPTLIVLGNEVEGVSKDTLKHSTHKVKIPMYGMSESLNVSVAGAVLLYEAQRQRISKGMYNKTTLSSEKIQKTLKKWAYDDIIAKELKRPRMKQDRYGNVEWLKSSYKGN